MPGLTTCRQQAGQGKTGIGSSPGRAKATGKLALPALPEHVALGTAAAV